MKTIPHIEHEILELQNEATGFEDDFPKEKKAKDKIRKRIALLRTCIKYLETNPAEELTRKMLGECGHKINVFERRLKEWQQSVPQSDLDKMKNPKSFYYKNIAPIEERELKNAKAQLKTLEYLIY